MTGGQLLRAPTKRETLSFPTKNQAVAPFVNRKYTGFQNTGRDSFALFDSHHLMIRIIMDFLYYFKRDGGRLDPLIFVLLFLFLTVICVLFMNTPRVMFSWHDYVHSDAEEPSEVRFVSKAQEHDVTHSAVVFLHEFRCRGGLQNGWRDHLLSMYGDTEERFGYGPVLNDIAPLISMIMYKYSGLSRRCCCAPFVR